MNLATKRGLTWHDLAAPIIAGIIASLIVNWLRNRK
ncbi:MAG: type I toxin-antitoxin system toxin Ldr family protein [Citrobacter freundii]|nr:type I toxin-antitoxin system toxin Ldr family protein [Citrobacter freundii]